MSLAILFRFFAGACGFLAAVEIGLAVWAVRVADEKFAAVFLLIAVVTFIIGYVFLVVGRSAAQLRIP